MVTAAIFPPPDELQLQGVGEVVQEASDAFDQALNPAGQTLAHREVVQLKGCGGHLQDVKLLLRSMR